MEIKRIRNSECEAFFCLLKAIDSETKYMMLEPDERQYNEIRMRDVIESQDDFLLGVYDNEKLVGFLSAQRGKYRRTRHSAYIVIGLREAYRNQGIGSALFDKLDEWSKEKRIKRLELTVEVQNSAAIHLYKSKGFTVEGLKKNRMLVDGELVDEYMMAKLN